MFWDQCFSQNYVHRRKHLKSIYNTTTKFAPPLSRKRNEQAKINIEHMQQVWCSRLLEVSFSRSHKPDEATTGWTTRELLQAKHFSKCLLDGVAVPLRHVGHPNRYISGGVVWVYITEHTTVQTTWKERWNNKQAAIDDDQLRMCSQNTMINIVQPLTFGKNI